MNNNEKHTTPYFTSLWIPDLHGTLLLMVFELVFDACTLQMGARYGRATVSTCFQLFRRNSSGVPHAESSRDQQTG